MGLEVINKYIVNLSYNDYFGGYGVTNGVWNGTANGSGVLRDRGWVSRPSRPLSDSAFPTRNDKTVKGYRYEHPRKSPDPGDDGPWCLRHRPWPCNPTPEEIKQLGTTLTPWGAIKAGNADGSIPAYTGGIEPPASYDAKKPQFRPDPFAAEKPLFSITAANMAYQV